jgi:predicted short-subunit dehydrogenase-like oxidoreductase (DUF2520 family)
MKAWRDRSAEDAQEQATAARERAETAAELEAAGIDLDPTPPGQHRHGGDLHSAGHAHPHQHAEPGERPTTGIVGGGAVGTALGVALSRAGWPVQAVASRDPVRRDRFRTAVDGARAFAEAQALIEEVELIILAVPDDAIAPLARSVRMYSGQAMIHTSGALGAEVLEPAMAAGTQVGAFHPLVAFADTDRAVAALHGATIAIEGDDQLASLLSEMAEAIGATAVRLAPGSKAAYHAAAVLAAGGFVALLDAIAELGRVAGLDEAGSLAIYGPLIEGTLDNARALGIRAALTGPITRGDVGTLRSHLAALATHAPGVVDLYIAAARREIELAVARGSLAPETAAALGNALAEPLARAD